MTIPKKITGENIPEKAWPWLLLFAGVFLAEALYNWKIYVLLWENSHVMAGLMESRWFYVSNNRFGMYATQILPVAGAQMGVSPSVLIGLQVLNYALLPVAILAIMIYGLKDFRHALLLFFFSAFGGLYIHFAKEYSLMPTLWLCLLLGAGLWQYGKDRRWPVLVSAGLLTIIIIFSHSLALFFLALICLTHWKRLSAGMILVCAGAIVLGLAASILQSDYIAGNVSSIESGISGFGVRVTLKALAELSLYFSSIFLVLITAYMIWRRGLDRYVALAWLSSIAMLFVALRYVMSVTSIPFDFDVSFLVNTRTEVTIFYIIAGLTYLALMRLEWSRSFLRFIIVLSIGRFVWLNQLSSELRQEIAGKEQLFDQVTADFPDKRIFIVDRACDGVPKGYEHDDMKHESAVMSWYKDHPAVLYLSDHLVVYEREGRPYFVNTAHMEVDLDDPTTYIFPFDPLREFGRWSFRADQVQLVSCQ